MKYLLAHTNCVGNLSHFQPLDFQHDSLQNTPSVQMLFCITPASNDIYFPFEAYLKHINSIFMFIKSWKCFDLF